jgi:uncharacterized repeat protein (TIGR01451 family)
MRMKRSLIAASLFLFAASARADALDCATDVVGGTTIDFEQPATMVNGILPAFDVIASPDTLVTTFVDWVTGNACAPISGQALYGGFWYDASTGTTHGRIETSGDPWSQVGMTAVSTQFDIGATFTLRALDVNGAEIGSVTRSFPGIPVPGMLTDDEMQAYNDAAVFLGFASATPIYAIELTSDNPNVAYDNLHLVSTAPIDCRPGCDADLGVVIYGPDVQVVGGDVYFSAFVTNYGPATATGIQLADQLPAGSMLVDASVCTGDGCQASCTETDGSLACSVPDLPQWGWAALDIHILAPTEEGPIVDSVAVTSDHDPFPGNDGASVTTQVVGGADLTGSIVLDGSRDSVATITVTNQGPDTAVGTQASDRVSGAQVLSISSSPGTCAMWQSSVGGCLLGDLAPGQSATIVVRTSPSGGTASHAVWIAAATPDPDYSDNGLFASRTLPGATTSSGVDTVQMFTWVDPGCPGSEPVILQGTFHVAYSTSVAPSGNGHLQWTVSPQSVFGVGVFSGDRYRGTGVTTLTDTFLGFPYTSTSNVHIELVDAVTGAHIGLDATAHFTIDASGRMTIDLSRYEPRCP